MLFDLFIKLLLVAYQHQGHVLVLEIVFCHLLNLSMALDMDLSDALRAKMIKNAVKYPAEIYRGKYTV